MAAGPLQTPCFEAVIVEPLSVGKIDIWSIADVKTWLQQQNCFGEEFILALGKERLDGLSLLNCTISRLEDKLLRENSAMGDTFRFVQLVYSLRQKWERRSVFERSPSGKYRISLYVGLSSTILELMSMGQRRFQEISVTTYLQRQQNFAGNQQVDPIMMPDRPEGDVVRQLDLRNVVIVQSWQNQVRFSLGARVVCSCFLFV